MLSDNYIEFDRNGVDLVRLLPTVLVAERQLIRQLPFDQIVAFAEFLDGHVLPEEVCPPQIA